MPTVRRSATCLNPDQGRRVQRWSAVAVALVLVATITVVAGCGGADRLTAADLSTVTVPTGINPADRVALYKGSNVQVQDGITTRVTLLKPTAVGHLDNDYAKDAVGIVRTEVTRGNAPPGDLGFSREPHFDLTGPSRASTIDFVSVVAFRNIKGKPVATAALPLGTGVEPSSITMYPPEISRVTKSGFLPARVAVRYWKQADPEHPREEHRMLTAHLTSKGLVADDDFVTDYGPASQQWQPIPLLGSNSSANNDGLAAFADVKRYGFSTQTGYQINVDVESAASGLRVGLTGADGSVLLDPASGKRSYHGRASDSQSYELVISSGDGRPADYSVKTSLLPPTAKRSIPGVNTSEKVLHLTFDDGPHPEWTPKVLDLLAKYHAKATFFVLGGNTARNPGLVKRELDEGHVVANHSYTHTDFRKLTHEAFESEVQRTQDLIGPRGAKCVRPPYGAVNSEVRGWIEAAGYSMVLWDVDTLDWKRPPADQIAQQVIHSAAPGTVVLMHDGGGNRANSVAALETILRELSAQGWRFESVCD